VRSILIAGRFDPEAGRLPSNRTSYLPAMPLLRCLAVLAILATPLVAASRLSAPERSAEAPIGTAQGAEPGLSTAASGPLRAAKPGDPHVYAIAHPKRPLSLYSAPGGRILARVGMRAEFGQPRALAVVSRRGRWDKVLDPAVYNRAAWVPAAQVRLTFTRVSLEVSLSRHLLVVQLDGRIVRRILVGVGAPTTPTPLGRFGVTDKQPGARWSPVYGCCVLALSGHQPHAVVDRIHGDRLAIHGTDALWTIGRNLSNGCLHASAADLAYLMRVVPLGAPVFIRQW